MIFKSNENYKYIDIIILEWMNYKFIMKNERR